MKSKNYEWNEFSCVGEGKFSHVFKGRRLSTDQASRQEVAVKVCRLSGESEYLEDIALLQGFDSPYITKYFAKEQVIGCVDKVAVVMELADGNLADELKKTENRHGISKAMFLVLVDNCISALEYLDDKNLSHRDVKPANILIFRNSREPKLVFKLCDFGLSLLLDDRSQSMYSLIGTGPYMLTRMFEKMEFPDEDLSYTKDEVDIWATTCSFFEASTGRHPFQHNAQTSSDIYSSIRDLVKNRPPDIVCAHYDAGERKNIYQTEMPEQHVSYTPSFRAILSRYFQMMYSKEKKFLNMKQFSLLSREMASIKEYYYYCLNSLSAETYCDTTPSKYFPRKSLMEAVQEAAGRFGDNMSKDMLEKYFIWETAKWENSCRHYAEPFAAAILRPGVFENYYYWKFFTGGLSTRVATLYETRNSLKIEIGHGNSVATREKKNYSLLKLAIEETIPSLVAYLRCIAQNSADADHVNRVPLLFAAIKEKSYDATATLLVEPVPLNQVNEKGESALGYAASGGNLNLIKLLVHCGADVASKNGKDRTPFYNACKKGHLEVAEYLLEQGSDINYKAQGRATPLMVAALRGWNDVVEMLIRRGADVNAVSHDDGRTALRDAASSNRFEILRLLLESGARLNVEEDGQFTPLYLACAGGFTEIATYLIDKGADINAAYHDGSTPLMKAIENGRDDIARMLIQRGADINSVAYKGKTVLWHAACVGHREIVSLVLQKGVQVDFPNNDGFTPLHIACENGHTNIVAQLLENGADANATTKGGDTPLTIAERVFGGNGDIIKLLHDHGATN